MRTVNGVGELEGLVGQELGSSEWHEIAQERVNAFADATGDHQWIHVDPERAAAGPFGGTIAHGYLTLSLLPMLMGEIWHVENVRMGINYGLNRVRFPAPVPVGSRVRATSRLKELTQVDGGVQLVVETTIEVEGGSKPVCVAESLVRFIA